MTNLVYLQSFVKECSEAAVEGTGEKFIFSKDMQAIDFPWLPMLI
jgi:hypothetical protein